MDKDKLAEALNAILNGHDAGNFHDELEIIMALVINVRDEDISAAWEEYITSN